MKNAYEIRLEVLQMAHSDLFHKFNEGMALIRYLADKNNEYSEVTDKIDSTFPKADDILKRAEELYAFVSEKN
jgi:hypothetical protein